MKRSLGTKKGFTLIELLVVVAIIGILAAVGVVAYNGYTSSAKKAAAKANHKQVVKFFQSQIMMCALDRYEMEHTSWPQCTKHKSWCNSSTDVAVFQSTFSNKFRCEMKNPYDSDEGFSYSYPQYAKTVTPTVVGRMHISTAWPKQNTVTLITKWGEGQNDILTTVLTQD